MADIDGDGRNEIVLAEGDPCIYGKGQGGKPLHGPEKWNVHVYCNDGVTK